MRPLLNYRPQNVAMFSSQELLPTGKWFPILIQRQKQLFKSTLTGEGITRGPEEEVNAYLTFNINIQFMKYTACVA